MKSHDGPLTVLETCMGLRRGECILVVFDRGHRGVVERFRRSARVLGADFATVEEAGGGREPSERVTRSMERSDVIIFCVDEGRTLLYGHSDARASSCKRGARIGFLTQSLDSVPERTELRRIHERVARMASMLSASNSVLIRSGQGRFALRAKVGRRALGLSSILTKKGSWGAVPDYAEAAVAPFESESEGEFCVDGTVVGIGPVSGSVVLKFSGGRLVSANDGGLPPRLLAESMTDEGASTLGELGFGANHLRNAFFGEFDDKKMLGSIHLGLGDNHTIGGTCRSAVHFDCLARSVQLELDGRSVDFSSL